MTSGAGPDYYTNGEIQCWDAAKVFLTPEEYIGACRFNINKYNWRLGHKGPRLEDAEKLEDYAHELVQFLKVIDR